MRIAIAIMGWAKAVEPWIGSPPCKLELKELVLRERSTVSRMCGSMKLMITRLWKTLGEDRRRLCGNKALFKQEAFEQGQV